MRIDLQIRVRRIAWSLFALVPLLAILAAVAAGFVCLPPDELGTIGEHGPYVEEILYGILHGG